MEYRFEFDEAKSRSNKQKHGIDFRDAQLLWFDERLLRLTARSSVENRYVFVGMLRRRLWSAIVTYRGQAIRLISVRRSRDDEAQAYGGR